MQRAACFLASRMVGPEKDCFNRLVVRQHRDQYVGIECSVVWRDRYACTVRAQLVSAAARAVIHRQLVPGPRDVPRHRLSHIAESDKSYFHGALPLMIMSRL